MSNSKNSNTVLWIGVSVAVGIVLGYFLNYAQKPYNPLSGNAQEAKVRKLINYIQYDYVDAVNTDSLLDITIDDLLKRLDPHSVYIPKNELSDVQETMEGKFTGIGVQFRMIRDTVAIINVIKNGPGEKAGLKAGDRILMAFKDTLFGKNLSSDRITEHLKSTKPDPIQLTVFRKSENKTLTFDFKRGNVTVESIPAYYMINNTLGYIKIEIFARNTYKEFHKALLELKNQECKLGFGFTKQYRWFSQRSQ